MLNIFLFVAYMQLQAIVQPKKQWKKSLIKGFGGPENEDLDTGDTEKICRKHICCGPGSL